MTLLETKLKNQVTALRDVVKQFETVTISGWGSYNVIRNAREVLIATAPEPSVISRTRLTNTRANHYKQYIVSLYDNNDVLCEWGKIGSTKQKQWHRGAGRTFAGNKIDEKEGEGYDRD